MAESFGTRADQYDRARPRYPAALLERILATSPGTDVLDVGCGTGIVARQLLAAGCRVLGVDVDARMVELARAGGAAAEVAAFEHWDTAGRDFDIVVSGQAWHWLDPVAATAKAAAALRPGGRLALFWNVFQPTPEVAAAFDRVYRSVLPENSAFSWTTPTLDVYAPIPRRAGAAIRADAAFGEPEEWRITWDHRYTRDDWLDQVPTFGNTNLLAPDRLAALLAGIGAAIDGLGGAFTMPYTTLAITALRTG